MLATAAFSVSPWQVMCEFSEARSQWTQSLKKQDSTAAECRTQIESDLALCKIKFT